MFGVGKNTRVNSFLLCSTRRSLESSKVENPVLSSFRIQNSVIHTEMCVCVCVHVCLCVCIGVFLCGLCAPTCENVCVCVSVDECVCACVCVFVCACDCV